MPKKCMKTVVYNCNVSDAKLWMPRLQEVPRFSIAVVNADVGRHQSQSIGKPSRDARTVTPDWGIACEAQMDKN